MVPRVMSPLSPQYCMQHLSPSWPAEGSNLFCYTLHNDPQKGTVPPWVLT